MFSYTKFIEVDIDLLSNESIVACPLVKISLKKSQIVVHNLRIIAHLLRWYFGGFQPSVFLRFL